MKNIKTVCSVGLVIVTLMQHYTVKTNTEGLRLIGNAEGCFLSPYYCPAGILTDGIGNTVNVNAKSMKDVTQVADDWSKNISTAERCITQYFEGSAMPENTFSAMVSVAFNLGCYRLRTYYNARIKRRVETTIHKKALLHEWRDMCMELPSFNNGGRYPGLTARRRQEMLLCLRGESER